MRDIRCTAAKVALKNFILTLKEETLFVINEWREEGKDRMANVIYLNPEGINGLYGNEMGFYMTNEYYGVFLPRTTSAWVILVICLEELYDTLGQEKWKYCPEVVSLYYNSDYNKVELKFWINVEENNLAYEYAKEMSKNFAEQLSTLKDFEPFECYEEEVEGGFFEDEGSKCAYFVGVQSSYDV